MEVLNIKIDGRTLKEIDSKLSKYRYSTRTEFVRDAIRGKLSDMEKDALLKKIVALQGSSKLRTTDEQLHVAREKAFELLDKIRRK